MPDHGKRVPGGDTPGSRGGTITAPKTLIVLWAMLIGRKITDIVFYHADMDPGTFGAGVEISDHFGPVAFGFMNPQFFSMGTVVGHEKDYIFARRYLAGIGTGVGPGCLVGSRRREGLGKCV